MINKILAVIVFGLAILIGTTVMSEATSYAMGTADPECTSKLSQDEATNKGATAYREVTDPTLIANIIEALASWKFTEEYPNAWPNVVIQKVAFLDIQGFMMVALADKDGCVWSNYNFDAEDGKKFIESLKGV